MSESPIAPLHYMTPSKTSDHMEAVRVRCDAWRPFMKARQPCCTRLHTYLEKHLQAITDRTSPQHATFAMDYCNTLNNTLASIFTLIQTHFKAPSPACLPCQILIGPLCAGAAHPHPFEESHPDSSFSLPPDPLHSHQCTSVALFTSPTCIHTHAHSECMEAGPVPSTTAMCAQHMSACHAQASRSMLLPTSSPLMRYFAILSFVVKPPRAVMLCAELCPECDG